MDCIFWNVRVLNSKEKQLDVKKFLASTHLSIIGLVETKIPPQNSIPIQRKILPGYFLLNPTSSGRIWLLWQPQLVHLTLLLSTDQYIHCKVFVAANNSSYYLTTVYASNSASDRRVLWSDLQFLTIGVGPAPWIIRGDFNEVRFSNEKVGGRPAHSRRISRFNRCISTCHLQDLKATGSPFSWSNNQSNHIACKLDRVLINNQWLLSFADSFVQFQAAGLSDHSVLQVTVKPPIPRGPRPFKYFQMWEERPDFIELIHTCWQVRIAGSPMFVLVKKLQHLKLQIKHQKKEVFGPIQRSSADSRMELSHAQENLMQNPTDPGLILLEADAKTAYLGALRQEDVFYRKKSRQVWLTQGDRNTKFFHAITKAWIASISIRKVKLANGHFSEDPAAINAHAVQFYKDLLNHDFTHFAPSYSPPHSLSEDDQQFLLAPITDDEIRKVLFTQRPISSPGPDGYPAHFFQFFWSLVCVDFLDAVKQFFQSGYLLKQLNHSFIALIPKSKHADSFENFRLISLCKTIYKTITKVLARRLQRVLPTLISSNQSAFIRGRNIVHNILLAHELMRYLHVPSAKGRTCIKIDIRKAFDSVRWDFLHQILVGMRFPAP
ncbi:hypothetical protein QJS10_CPB21g01579 [Acorus calamus]|uniref:Reverse transcriptase domain-containing protein n=1 Tax=Acorus calamus TaxID=4465 RepID=A0AAV9C1R1_ACOCL|nr:hypothetical protein QJS10_CPB21g01579 [Acorus calamus]